MSDKIPKLPSPCVLMKREGFQPYGDGTWTRCRVFRNELGHLFNEVERRSRDGSVLFTQTVPRLSPSKGGLTHGK